MTQKHISYLTNLGEILVAVGAIVWITNWLVSEYIFAIGTLLFLIGRLLEKHDTTNLVLKRLYRQRMIGGIMLLASAVMMIAYTLSHTAWLIPFIIFTVIETYTVFRIDNVTKKLKK